MKHHRRRLRSAGLLGTTLAVLSLTAACGAGDSAGSSVQGSPAVQKLAKAAEKEGRVVLYTSLNSVTTDKLAASFKEAYGVDLVVKPVASQSAGQQKIEQETRAKNVQADVFVNTVDVNWAKKVGDEGGLADLNTLPDLDTLDAKFRSTYYIAPVLDLAGMAYNPSVVKEGELPQTPDEFVSSKVLRGNTVILDPEIGGSSVNVHDVLYRQLGGDKFDSFVKGLFGQLDASVTADFGVALSQVSSGEKAAFWPIPSRGVAPLKASGAPIAMHYFDPVPAVSSGVSVTRSAPHPAAAKLLANWFLSKEAATILCADEAMARPGLDVKGALKMPDGVQFADPAEATKIYQKDVLPAFGKYAR